MPDEPTSDFVARKGLWLTCPNHPDGQTCWVRLSATNWPTMAGRSAVWCYECKRPIALVRDGDSDESVPLRRAVEQVIDHWDTICEYRPDRRGWDFDDTVAALRQAWLPNDSETQS